MKSLIIPMADRFVRVLGSALLLALEVDPIRQTDGRVELVMVGLGLGKINKDQEGCRGGEASPL